MAATYLRGWFIIDLLSVFPFEKIIESVSEGDSSGSYNKLIRVARIGKLYRLVRLTKLLRVLKLFKKKDSMFS